MALVLLTLLVVWPLVELAALVAVADAIGLGWAVLALIGVSALGVVLLKRSGLSVWRRANAEVAAGRPPARQLLDGALVLAGGLALVVPGFVSGAIGALLMLPPVRALLRPVMAGWLGTRAARAARSSRIGGVFVDTTIGADGRVRQRTTRFGDVIDAEGWEVEPPTPELPSGVVDVEGTRREGRRSA